MDVPRGAVLTVDVADGPKGPQVAAVTDIDFSTAQPNHRRPFDTNCTSAISGTVKWFHPTRGYGFIVPDEGGGIHTIRSMVGCASSAGGARSAGWAGSCGRRAAPGGAPRPAGAPRDGDRR